MKTDISVITTGHSAVARLILATLASALAVVIGCAGPGSSRDVIFGTVASELAYAESNAAAGVHAATVEVYWDRLQPTPDRFDAARFEQTRQDLAVFRDAGMEVVLDLGLQYPPAWAFELPHSRYVNQYGDAYVDDRPGANGLNAVFNQEIRDLQAAYVARVFQELGNDFYAVRLGWGFYGELSYPIHTYDGRNNAYWAYGEVAQGRAPGLATTLVPNPAPGWIPGERSEEHQSARDFVIWYLDAMTDYQSWQIKLVRRHYEGRLAVLYPSWGLRPGQLEAAIARDLSGFTSPEQNGEIQRGHDFARHVGDLNDRRVVVYTTWLDASPAFSVESSDDAAVWSPVHYLAQLALDHRFPLEVWGENTGNGSATDMALCFERLKAFNLTGLFWAFDEQLHQGAGDYASIADYAGFIDTYRPGE